MKPYLPLEPVLTNKPHTWSRVYRATDGPDPVAWQLTLARETVADWRLTAPPLSGHLEYTVAFGLGPVFAQDLHLPQSTGFAGILLGTQSARVITALSVLDHLGPGTYRAFLRKCTNALAPGGLLFLTAAYWDCEGPDLTRSRVSRQRIYQQDSWNRMRKLLNEDQLKLFGAVDWTYPGPQIDGDHTLVSLAMVKQR